MTLSKCVYQKQMLKNKTKYKILTFIVEKLSKSERKNTKKEIKNKQWNIYIIFSRNLS